MCLSLICRVMMFLVVLFTIFMLSVGQEQHDFYKYPVNITVYQDEFAEFTCGISGGYQNWALNGKPHVGFPPEDVDTSRRENLYVLTIRARSEYNGTSVQCLIDFDLSNASDIVILSIQGKPPPLGDLNVTYNTSSVNISWTPLFSLDVTGVDPDIWYSVIIYNVTDENNSAVVDCTYCINITDTHYTFTPSPCTIYNISVIPINGAGLGNVSENVTVEGESIERVRIASTDDGDMCALEFGVECDVHTVEIMSYPLETGYTSTSDVSSGVEKFNLSAENGMVNFSLPAKRIYNTSFSLDLVQRKTKFQITETFTTYDIQNPHAESVGDNKITVTGEFIENSTAIGCFLAIECHSTFRSTFIALRQPGNGTISEVITITAADYTVFVHDLEENSLPYTKPSSTEYKSIHVPGNDIAPNNSKCGNITRNNERVTVNCSPGRDNTSCIVVYRAYGNSTLNLRYNEPFPLVITLNNSVTTNYTIALFLVDDIEERPCMSEMVPVTAVLPSLTVTSSLHVTATPTASTMTAIMPSTIPTGPVPVIAISVGTTLAVAIVLVSAIVIFYVFLVIERHQLEKKHGINYSSSLRFLYDSCRYGFYKGQGFGSRRKRDGARNEYTRVENGGLMSSTSSSSSSSSSSSYTSATGPVQYATVETRPGQPLCQFKTSKVNYHDIDHLATNRLAINIRSDSGPSNEPVVRSEVAILSSTVSFPALPDNSTNVSGNTSTTANNAEKVMEKLYDRSDQWRIVAEMMGFNEDVIFTNDETNEAFLQNCVEQWVGRLGGSWEKLSDIINKLDENSPSEEAETTGESEPNPEEETGSVCQQADVTVNGSCDKQENDEQSCKEEKEEDEKC